MATEFRFKINIISHHHFISDHYVILHIVHSIPNSLLKFYFILDILVKYLDAPYYHV